MRFPAKGVLWLLPLMLSACVGHKTDQAQVEPLAPPIVDAPPVKPATPTDLPPPVVNAPAQAPTTTTPTPQAEPEQPAPRKKPPVAKPPEQASNDNPGVSAIGQLSTGDPSDLRKQTVNSLTATERGLQNIGRKLNDQEEKTAIQIREFVKQARQALTSGDVDGANTLASKAKVLLEELTR
jgi:ribosomal protein S20